MSLTEGGGKWRSAILPKITLAIHHKIQKRPCGYTLNTTTHTVREASSLTQLFLHVLLIIISVSPHWGSSSSFTHKTQLTRLKTFRINLYKYMLSYRTYFYHCKCLNSPEFKVFSHHRFWCAPADVKPLIARSVWNLFSELSRLHFKPTIWVMLHLDFCTVHKSNSSQVAQCKPYR